MLKALDRVKKVLPWAHVLLQSLRIELQAAHLQTLGIRHQGMGAGLFLRCHFQKNSLGFAIHHLGLDLTLQHPALAIGKGNFQSVPLQHTPRLGQRQSHAHVVLGRHHIGICARHHGGRQGSDLQPRLLRLVAAMQGVAQAFDDHALTIDKVQLQLGHSSLSPRLGLGLGRPLDFGQRPNLGLQIQGG